VAAADAPVAPIEGSTARTNTIELRTTVMGA
jgi:hypothetical protein